MLLRRVRLPLGFPCARHGIAAGLSKRNACGNLLTRSPYVNAVVTKTEVFTRRSVSSTGSTVQERVLHEIETEPTVQERVLHEIETEPVVIFGESHCLACSSAEKKFKKLGVEPAVFHLDLGDPHSAASVASLLRDLTGGAALPCVFVAGKHMLGSQALGKSQQKDVKAAVQKHALKLRATQEIEGNHVVIFSKTYCPSCVQTKQAFQDIGVGLAIFELDSDKMKGNVQIAEGLQVVLAEMTGRLSLPYVFVGGNFVGGSDEISALARSGNLRDMVNAAVSGI